MLGLDPAPTQFDLRFQLFGIPVRIHPWFWIVAVLLGNLRGTPVELLIWVAVVFVSILVHELGHALAMRRYGQRPRIVLYAFGGYATAQPEYYSWAGSTTASATRLSAQQQIHVLLAGPGAGFLLACVVLVAIKLCGGDVGFARDFPIFWRFRLPVGNPRDYWLLYMTVFQLLYVNVWWGLINLLPVWPLDGGQIARVVCLLVDPWRGLGVSLIISTCVGAGIAVWALLQQEIFLAVLFGMLAWSSYQMMVPGMRG
ncbi:MAG: peptidase [Pirellulaceae bacterium]|nr:MAG: peptidase [Pirellulaceae bacterium]